MYSIQGDKKYSTVLYSILGNMTVHRAGLNSQKYMTGQYRYEQWTQRYDETIRACTVYNEIW